MKTDMIKTIVAAIVIYISMVPSSTTSKRVTPSDHQAVLNSLTIDDENKTDPDSHAPPNTETEAHSELEDIVAEAIKGGDLK